MSKFQKQGPSAGQWQWALFIAFISLIAVVTVYGVSATLSLRSREGIVTYLQDESLWDHCIEEQDRDFFIAVSDLIDMSTANGTDPDPAARADALSRLHDARDRMRRVDHPDVCGPPPVPPTK
jgi:hypothetical protein